MKVIDLKLAFEERHIEDYLKQHDNPSVCKTFYCTHIQFDDIFKKGDLKVGQTAFPSVGASVQGTHKAVVFAITSYLVKDEVIVNYLATEHNEKIVTI